MAMATARLLVLLLLSTSCFSAPTLLGKVHPGGKLLRLQLGSPAQSHDLQLDLDADVSWLPSCVAASTNASSSYVPIPCSSPGGVCPSGKCSASQQCLQAISKVSTVSLFRERLGSLYTTDPSTSGPVTSTSVINVTFGCQQKSGRGRGVAAFSMNSLSLPLQLARIAKLPPKFTLCLSGDSTSQVFFGDDSSIVLGGINFSDYTTVSFSRNAFHPTQYYLPLERIRIQDDTGMDLGGTPAGVFVTEAKTGTGGIKFSSRERYTKLASPAYVAVRDAFSKYTSRLGFAPRSSIYPLEFCFDASSINFSRLGPVVPTVELVMAGGSASWTMAGTSVIEIFNETACLAFIDAGQLPVTSSIGLYQQYDNLLRFDIGSSRFGFIDRGLHLYRMNCRV